MVNECRLADLMGPSSTKQRRLVNLSPLGPRVCPTVTERDVSKHQWQNQAKWNHRQVSRLPASDAFPCQMWCGIFASMPCFYFPLCSRCQGAVKGILSRCWRNFLDLWPSEELVNWHGADTAGGYCVFVSDTVHAHFQHWGRKCIWLRNACFSCCTVKSLSVQFTR